MSKKFLIGQLGCFGDCLLATTIAKQIKNDYPDSHITWAVSTQYKAIVELNPYIDSIWEISLNYGWIDQEGWQKFEKEAELAKSRGHFDQIFYTQVHHKNIEIFYSTLRKTVFSIYDGPITVDVSPVVRLSEREVKNVKEFAKDKKLADFKHVILFECAPRSGQSPVNVSFALQVAKAIVEKRKDICLILSTPKTLEFVSPQIIDGSKLTFRENAELTKYCNLLIGCCSGITWISTSDWAKKLPMLQLLDYKSRIFSGVHYDFELNNLDNSNLIEMLKFDPKTVVECLISILENGPEKTKLTFHEEYKPNSYNIEAIARLLFWEDKSFFEVLSFARKYVKANKKRGNRISLKYVYFVIYAYYYCHIRASEKGLFFQIRRVLKFILAKKSSSSKQEIKIEHI
jgi:hypothetical protein